MTAELESLSLSVNLGSLKRIYYTKQIFPIIFLLNISTALKKLIFIFYFFENTVLDVLHLCLSVFRWTPIPMLISLKDSNYL